MAKTELDFIDSPSIRPSLNVGSLFDVASGVWHLGKRGESYLNGGLLYSTGFVGRPNMYKSTLAHFHYLMARLKYRAVTNGASYDTEIPSISPHRMDHLYQVLQKHGLYDELPFLNEVDEPDRKMRFTDAAMMKGENFWEVILQKGERKVKEKDYLTTPFLIDPNNPSKGCLQMIRPSLYEIDSLSNMTFEAIEDTLDTNGDITSSKNNTLEMTSARYKASMINRMSHVLPRHSDFLIMTGHVGDKIVLDTHAAPEIKLHFLKNLKIKKVPEPFNFLVNNVYFNSKLKTMQHKDTKAPLYPRNSDDDQEGDTDLQCVTTINLRGKNGKSGLPFDVLFSQQDGVIANLTDFNYCKENEFGISGNDRNYYLDLCPDVKLSRTTVRSKLDESQQASAAAHLTAEIAYMFNNNNLIKSRYGITMPDLYQTIIDKGGDWEKILSCRNHWVFEEQFANERDFISSMDLLRWAKGEYTPYWM